MTKNIYEYKNASDWYVAEWGKSASYSEFERVPAEASEILDRLESILAEEELGLPLNITVIRYGSAFRFLTFLLDILNQETGRKLELLQRQGALLLVEAGKLLYVHLPQTGVDLQAFLGAKDVKDTLLIATRNEGKTAEFRKLFGKLGYEVKKSE